VSDGDGAWLWSGVGVALIGLSGLITGDGVTETGSGVGVTEITRGVDSGSGDDSTGMETARETGAELTGSGEIEGGGTDSGADETSGVTEGDGVTSMELNTLRMIELASTEAGAEDTATEAAATIETFA